MKKIICPYVLSTIIFYLSLTAFGSDTEEIKYEAEEALVSDGASIKTDEVNKIKYVEIKSSGSIKWEVEVPEDGRYLLTFQYRCIGGDKVQNIIMNDSKKWQIGFPLYDGEWSSVKWYTETQ